jgi:hypothetical protein
MERSVGQVDADAGACDEVAVDPVARGPEPGVGRLEALLIPEVNARLVLDLHAHAQVGHRFLHALDHDVFGFPRQVGVVEVEDVVVLHAPAGRFVGKTVPRRLEQAAGGQEALAKPEAGQA